jgi:hypothetical protein
LSSFLDETEELSLTFPDEIPFRRFDDLLTHRLPCMSKVDFIVEELERYLFIEVKNRNNPGDESSKNLYLKFADTYLYEHFFGRAEKDIYYVVLFGGRRLDEALLFPKTDELKQRLPVKDRNSPIPRKHSWVTKIAVHSISSWNNEQSQYPLTRVIP